MHQLQTGFLLGKFIQGSDKVENLHDVKTSDMKTTAPWTIVRSIDAITQPVHYSRAGTAHEVIEEVIHQLDNIHDGL